MASEPIEKLHRYLSGQTFLGLVHTNATPLPLFLLRNEVDNLLQPWGLRPVSVWWALYHQATVTALGRLKPGSCCVEQAALDLDSYPYLQSSVTRLGDSSVRGHSLSTRDTLVNSQCWGQGEEVRDWGDWKLTTTVKRQEGKSQASLASGLETVSVSQKPRGEGNSQVRRTALAFYSVELRARGDKTQERKEVKSWNSSV